MNTSTTRLQPRRGAAMIIAITMIGFVALALVMVGRLTTADARRSADERIGTQLRMMLLAGQDWVQANVESLKPGENVVPLPSALAEGTLVCELGSADAETSRSIIVRASLLEREEMQALTFTRVDTAWTLQTAVLEPMRRK